MTDVTSMKKLAVIATAIRLDDIVSKNEGEEIMGVVTRGQTLPQMPVEPPVVFIAVHDPRAREDLLRDRKSVVWERVSSPV